jgi:hypothetical protein
MRRLPTRSACFLAGALIAPTIIAMGCDEETDRADRALARKGQAASKTALTEPPSSGANNVAVKKGKGGQNKGAPASGRKAGSSKGAKAPTGGAGKLLAPEKSPHPDYPTPAKAKTDKIFLL